MKIRKDLENTLIVLFFTALIASMTLYLYFYPPSREAFFETAILTSKNTIDPHDYFKLGNSTASIGENINWTLQAISHMPDAQYIQWQAILLNDTYTGVDPTTCTPSPQPTFYQTRSLLLPGNSWNLTINWIITSASKTGKTTTLRTLLFQGATINPNLPASSSTGYRILFELWYFSPTTNFWTFAFPYTYEGSPGLRCWWTQVYFYVAHP